MERGNRGNPCTKYTNRESNLELISITKPTNTVMHGSNIQRHPGIFVHHPGIRSRLEGIKEKKKDSSHNGGNSINYSCISYWLFSDRFPLAWTLGAVSPTLRTSLQLCWEFQKRPLKNLIKKKNSWEQMELVQACFTEFWHTRIRQQSS